MTQREKDDPTYTHVAGFLSLSIDVAHHINAQVLVGFTLWDS